MRALLCSVVVAATVTAGSESIAADWRRWQAQIGDGALTFDAALEDLCVRTNRAIGESIANALERHVPNHAVLGYLRSQVTNRLLNRIGPEIHAFSAAEPRLHAEGFAVPANWIRGGPLQGIRYLIFRPGLADPATVSAPRRINRDAALDTFPVAAADYREVFASLDLEVRFQIVTTSDALRRDAVAAFRSALDELRAEDAKRGVRLQADHVPPRTTVRRAAARPGESRSRELRADSPGRGRF